MGGPCLPNETPFMPWQPIANSLRTFGELVRGVADDCPIVGGRRATCTAMADHKQWLSHTRLVQSPLRLFVSVPWLKTRWNTCGIPATPSTQPPPHLAIVEKTLNSCFLIIVPLIFLVSLNQVKRICTCSVQSEKLSSLTRNLVDKRKSKGSEWYVKPYFRASV
jgi:hypothetical protein